MNLKTHHLTPVRRRLLVCLLLLALGGAWLGLQHSDTVGELSLSGPLRFFGPFLERCSGSMCSGPTGEVFSATLSAMAFPT